MTNNHSSGSFVLFFNKIMTLEQAKLKRLTEHFTLYEMMRSETAESRNIDNMPDATQVENLKFLCEKILELLRRNFGVIKINSGFRCPILNDMIHSVSCSQHMTGEAADIHCENPHIARKYFNFIANHCRYDQLLFEYRRGGAFWIHVSLRRGDKNRNMRIENYPAKH